MNVEQILGELRDIRREVATGNDPVKQETSSYLYGRLSSLVRSIEREDTPRIVGVNLNEDVRIRLFKCGTEILEESGADGRPKPDAEGFVTMPFREVMRIFGPAVKPWYAQPMSMEVEVLRR